MQSLLQCSPANVSIIAAAVLALKLAALHLPVLFFAFSAARAMAGNDRAARVAAGLLVYFLAVETACWFSPGLTLPWLFGWAVLYGVAGVLIRRLFPGGQKPRAAFLSAGVLAVVLLAAALLITGIFQPRFDHDPLTYQLYFAAAWLRNGAINIVPTPFGDPSQAYGPSLASTFYLWLMAPLASDMLAQVGQWAFLVLALAAAIGLARELGAKKELAFTAGLLMFTAPLLVYEGRSAFSDLAVAAFFTASIHFFMRATRTGRGTDACLALVAAGLMGGCKYTGLPLLLVLAPFALLAAAKTLKTLQWRWWFAGAAGGLAGGGVWCLRNWIVSGNPVFPIKVSIAGHQIFPGLYGRGEMLGWVFHAQGLDSWFLVMITNASPVLAGLGGIASLLILAGTLPGVITGKGMLHETTDNDSGPAPEKTASRATLAAVALAALVPIIVDRLYWNLMPYQVDRFWIAAVPVLCAVCAAAAAGNLVLSLAVVAASYAGLFLVPAPAHLGAGTWNWIKIAMPAAGIIAVALAFLWKRLAARPDTPDGPVLSAWIPAALVLLFFMLVTVAGLASYQSRRAAALSSSQYGPGWSMLPCPAPGLTVAYAGANVPYPLAGPTRDNRVIYVSPSGVLMPEDHLIAKEMGSALPRFKTPEPAVERLELCPSRWARTLMDAGADYLFVMRVGRNALVNVEHDRGGWPIEDTWARRAAGTFQPVYNDRFTRLYRINRSMKPSFSEACVERPADGPSVCPSSPDQCERFFPHAREAMRAMGVEAESDLVH